MGLNRKSIDSNFRVYGAFMSIGDVFIAGEYLRESINAGEIEPDGWADETISRAALTEDIAEVRITATDAFLGEFFDLLKVEIGVP